MARVDLVNPHDADDPEVREFAPKVTKPDGSVGGHFSAESHFPEVMMPVYEARLALARKGDLGNWLFTKLAVAISMTNEWAYCVGAYSGQFSRQLGGDEAVREFQQAVCDGDVAGKEGDVVDFAQRLIRDPRGLADVDFDRMRTDYDFTDRTFVELIYVVNIVSGYNRLTVGLDLEYDHDYPEEWAREAAAPMSETATADDRPTGRSRLESARTNGWHRDTADRARTSSGLRARPMSGTGRPPRHAARAAASERLFRAAGGLVVWASTSWWSSVPTGALAWPRPSGWRTPPTWS